MGRVIGRALTTMRRMTQSRIFLKLVAAGAVFFSAGGPLCNNLLYAQTLPGSPNLPMYAMPQHQVSLSAQAHAQAVPDWLSVVLTVQREGTEPQALQAQIQKALDAALTQAKASAAQVGSGAIEVRTGAFQMQPRYGTNGRMNGWVGQAELVLQGRDLALIAQTAAQLNTMVVQSLNFSLAPDTRRQLETQLQAQAIARFRERAQHITEAFGYRSYTLGQVDVGTLDAGGQVLTGAPKLLMRAAMVESATAPIPTEPGTTSLQLSVSGMVTLQK